MLSLWRALPASFGAFRVLTSVQTGHPFESIMPKRPQVKTEGRPSKKVRAYSTSSEAEAEAEALAKGITFDATPASFSTWIAGRGTLSKDLGHGVLKPSNRNVEAAAQLLIEGCSVPFISRYRRDRTGGMSDEVVERVSAEWTKYQHLQQAKTDAVSKLAELKVLNKQLLTTIKSCEKLVDVNDLVNPYKSARKTKASVAREAGLEPLSTAILQATASNSRCELTEPITKEMREEAIQTAFRARTAEREQALDIVADVLSNHPPLKRIVERSVMEFARLTVDIDTGHEEHQQYKDLQRLSGKSLSRLLPHQVHGLFRGEKSGAIKVKFGVEKERLLSQLQYAVNPRGPKALCELVNAALKDSLTRLMLSRAERAARHQAKEKADLRASTVFQQNLQDMLQLPPVRVAAGVCILGVDPGIRTGAKCAVISSNGAEVASTFVLPYDKSGAACWPALESALKEHKIGLIAIGNGTGGRHWVDVIQARCGTKFPDTHIMMVPETGASVYSASAVARQELPDLAVDIRGAVSIARRVLDPLNELVKIEPMALGVGQYQHDLDQSILKDSLTLIVTRVVNSVGIDLDTASPHVLQYVSGLSLKLGQSIVNYREENAGSLRGRDWVRKVAGIGETKYDQSIGFLRAYHSPDDLFASTGIHPSQSEVAETILSDLGYSGANGMKRWANLRRPDRAKLLGKVNISNYEGDDDVHGALAIRYIIQELELLGADPRGPTTIGELIEKEHSRNVENEKKLKAVATPKSFEDLKSGMQVAGVVSNLTDFGAFIDLGIHKNGLVHIGQIRQFASETGRTHTSNSPLVKVGDKIVVNVISVDSDRKRIQLGIIEQLS